MDKLIEFIYKVLGQLPGFILGIAAVLGTGFVKEFFDERARKRKHKLEVVRHVLRICNEASTGNYQLAPRNIEGINHTLTDVDGIDKEIGEVMNSFFSLWQIFRVGAPTMEENEAKFTTHTLKELEEKRKILVSWANKIRTGN